MRERFWIGENHRYEVVRQIPAPEASKKLPQFLSSGYGLKLTEWQHFYRLLDSVALTHLFRVDSGLDSRFRREPQIAAQVEAACQKARTVGAAGPFLNSAPREELEISKQIRSETAIPSKRRRYWCKLHS